MLRLEVLASAFIKEIFVVLILVASSAGQGPDSVSKSNWGPLIWCTVVEVRKEGISYFFLALLGVEKGE